jgi:hypothetical protein
MVDITGESEDFSDDDETGFEMAMEQEARARRVAKGLSADAPPSCWTPRLIFLTIMVRTSSSAWRYSSLMPNRLSCPPPYETTKAPAPPAFRVLLTFNRRRKRRGAQRTRANQTCRSL